MKRVVCFFAVLMLQAFSEGAATETDSCLATSDLNGDGTPLTLSDLGLMIQVTTCEAPAPSNLYEVDLNGDCKVDRDDVFLYASYVLFSPPPPPFQLIQTCCNPALVVYPAGSRGDVNVDGEIAPVDVVAILNCVFTETEQNCSFCQTDLNCDFALTPADVVQELNYVFNGTAPVGCP